MDPSAASRAAVDREDAIRRRLAELGKIPRKPPASLRRRIVVGAIAGALVALTLLQYGYSSQWCAGCGCLRTIDAWDFGWGDSSWVTLGRSERLRDTRALRDLFPADHRHEWRLWNARTRGFQPWNMGACVDGSWFPNFFARDYEDDPALRDLVQRKIASGEVKREEVARLVGLPGYTNRYRLPSVPAGTHALIRRANAWMAEAHSRRKYLWPDRGPDSGWPPEVAADPGRR